MATVFDQIIIFATIKAYGEPQSGLNISNCRIVWARPCPAPFYPLSSMIRPTVAADHDALIALATATGLFEPDQTQLLAKMMQSPAEEEVWFTDDDGKGPVGVAYLVPEKMTHGTWNLCWIAVHPDQQKQGRGKAILSHIEQWLMEQGERILLVETAGTDDFDYVRQFYADNGFEPEARIRDFYDSEVDKIIFRKTLTPKN